MSDRKNIKLNESTFTRLKEEKGEYETWDGSLNRVLDELERLRDSDG